MRKWILVLFVLLTAGSFAFAKAAQQTDFQWGSPGQTPLLVGAAIRDVSPTKENGMLPIPAVGWDTPVVDVVDPIHTRVIALQNGATKALIVCTETGKGPYGPQFAALLSAHTGIPIDAIFYMTTHTHSAPELTGETGVIDLDFLDFKEGDPVTNPQRWGKYVLEQMYSAADEALAKLQPAKVAIGHGESYINVNRNRTYISDKGTSQVYLGFNPLGVADRTLAVMRFDTLDDKPIAFLINYPMHLTTMFANVYFEDGQGLSADIGGFVSTLLEKQNPGAVAMWTSGAAGDQNPLYTNTIQVPNPETGEFSAYFTGLYDIVVYWGSIHFADIKAVLNTMGKGTPNLPLSYAAGSSTIPTREGTGAAEFPLYLKVLRLGDIVFAGSPGELYSSLGMYMKDKSPLRNTIVFNHVWTQEGAYLSYILDDESIAKGGYGYERVFYKEGTISDGLADLMNALIAKTR
jgi:hypothetical protein